MFYTGCDVHKANSTLHHMDEDQAYGLHGAMPTIPEDLSRFLDQLHEPTMVTFEASCGYYWLNRFFENHPMVAGVHVVDPRRSRKLAAEFSVQAGYGRAKNDHIDAEMLAEIERMGVAPKIHVPTEAQQEKCANRRKLFINAILEESCCKFRWI